MAPSTLLPDVAGWCVLVVHGELDIAASPRLREQLVDLIAAGERQIIVDLSDVTFMDSTGLAVLIGALKRLRWAGGEIRVVVTNESVLRVMRVAGVHRIITASRSVAEAIAPPGAPRASAAERSTGSPPA